MAFQLGHTPAHTGKSIAEEPIRSLDSIQAIKQNLHDNPRDYCLFVLGINTAFRAGDLSGIKVGQVRGDELVVREEKTNKIRRVTLNDQAKIAVARLIEGRKDDEFLFEGQRGQLTTSYINRLVKRWVAAVGITGQYGSHSLRKSWAYHQYSTFKVRIEILMQALNHSSPQQTLTYICIQSEDMKEVYSNSL